MADHIETFDEFKNSFSYGSRTDLSFKFLKALDPEEAAEFLRQVLQGVGELYDDPSADDLIDLIYEWQVGAYQPKPEAKRHYVYDDSPFQTLGRSLGETTLGLVTSSGHYTGEDPTPVGVAEMSQADAIERIDDFMREAPVLSVVQRDTPAREIDLRHPGYDIRSASRDHNVAFPRGPLEEAEHEGRIGRLADMLYSFVGVCSQGRLRNGLDGWIDDWQEAGIEALFLVPV